MNMVWLCHVSGRNDRDDVYFAAATMEIAQERVKRVILEMEHVQHPENEEEVWKDYLWFGTGMEFTLCHKDGNPEHVDEIEGWIRHVPVLT